MKEVVHHKTTYLKDYKNYPFTIVKTFLEFILDPNHTLVYSELKFKIRENSLQDEHKNKNNCQILLLDGEELELLYLAINGVQISKDVYQKHSEALSINLKKVFLKNFRTKIQQGFKLQSLVKISPIKNTDLTGLYISNQVFCTQCEASSFRRICYYPDRPDVTSKFWVNIIAKKTYPILLSNGNLIDKKLNLQQTDIAIFTNKIIDSIPSEYLIALQDITQLHSQQWQDPFLKPCYLFALVAGDLGVNESYFMTKFNKKILLQIYTEKGQEYLTGYAMRSLKKSFAWEEQIYKLEYDLERFMLVAIDNFNMGAMENKGLNIFNSKYVFADPKLTTDNLYVDIEAIIAHEYFHNYSGNRVTLRDWFQLTLKEGLTVFREQQFSETTLGFTAKRIRDVELLQRYQFAEDVSKLAHPPRPTSYIEMNNFYTATVYEKGAEIVRLYKTLLGDTLYYRAMQTYFHKYDGMGVTLEDFFEVMYSSLQKYLKELIKLQAKNNKPIYRQEQEFLQTKFLACHMPKILNWYKNTGIPRVRLKFSFNNANEVLSIESEVSLFARFKKIDDFADFIIPIKIAVFNNIVGATAYQELKLLPITENIMFDKKGEVLLLLTSKQDLFLVKTVKQWQTTIKPKQSVKIKGKDLRISSLRDFSAPIILDLELSALNPELNKLQINTINRKYIAQYDTNNFVSWKANQELMLDAFINYCKCEKNKKDRQNIILELTDLQTFNLKKLSSLIEDNHHLIVKELQASSINKALPQQVFDSLTTLSLKIEPVELQAGKILLFNSDVKHKLSYQQINDFYKVQTSNFAITNQEVLPSLFFELKKLCSVESTSEFKPLLMVVRNIKLILLHYLNTITYISNINYGYVINPLVELKEQYYTANNFSEKIGYFQLALEFSSLQEQQEIIVDFYEKYKKYPQVIDSWFAIQVKALQVNSSTINALEKIKQLLHHQDFCYKNPNRIRSVFGTWISENSNLLHQVESYTFLKRELQKIDKINPQIASSLLSAWIKSEPLHLKLKRKRTKILTDFINGKFSKNLTEVAQIALNIH